MVLRQYLYYKSHSFPQAPGKLNIFKAFLALGLCFCRPFLLLIRSTYWYLPSFKTPLMCCILHQDSPLVYSFLDPYGNVYFSISNCLTSYWFSGYCLYASWQSHGKNNSFLVSTVFDDFSWQFPCQGSRKSSTWVAKF